MYKPAPHWINAGLVALLTLVVVLNLQVAAPTVRADAGWRDTGLTLPAPFDNSYQFSNFSDINQNICFDATHPRVLLVNAAANSFGGAGIHSFNWQSGQETAVSNRLITNCSQDNGLLFQKDSATNKFYRLSAPDLQPRPIDHYPTYVATDGTAQLYALEPPTSDLHSGYGQGQLWYSADGGQSWQQRNGSIGPIASLAVSQSSAQVIYGLTYIFDEATGKLTFSIYFSADAGLSWQKRYDGTAQSSGFGDISIHTLSGHTATADTLVLAIGNGIPGSNAGENYFLSNDGARTFNAIGSTGFYLRLNFYQTSQGVVRLFYDGQKYNLNASSDGGKSWQPLNLPFTPYSLPGSAQILQANTAPDNLFLYSSGYSGSSSAKQQLWYSADGGAHWQQLNLPDLQQMAFAVTPYLPLTLLGERKDGRLFAYDIADAGKSLTKGVAANALPPGNSQYFDQTRHNISPLFYLSWQSQGGLAQFGYPKTEAFRELNPADGKVYTVQYFERNRFEYHPEFAGTAYEVELGLLGNQLTAARKAAGEGAFNSFVDAHYAGGIYFPQTGHNLRNSFKDYWQAHGGLAIFGYPISEEFYEVNPDDGQTYVVQYFERNRFEYHPNLKGTPYEVELGLLGNTLLTQKGWLPVTP